MYLEVYFCIHRNDVHAGIAVIDRKRERARRELEESRGVQVSKKVYVLCNIVHSRATYL